MVPLAFDVALLSKRPIERHFVFLFRSGSYFLSVCSFVVDCAFDRGTLDIEKKRNGLILRGMRSDNM